MIGMKKMHSWKRGGAAILLAATLLLCGCSGSAQDSTTTVPPTTEVERIPVELDVKTDALFFGRTYATGGVEWFNWSGSGFSVRFRGSGLVAELYSNVPDNRNTAYLKVYIDGVEQEDIALKKDIQMVTLAEGLDPNAEHTVQVRKRTNARSSTAGVSRLVLTDGEVLEPEKPKERLIEFLGDSLTVGYVAGKGGKTAGAWTTMTEDVTNTYCPQIADAFDAEYQVVAISGRGIVRNNGGDENILFPEIYEKTDIYNAPDKMYDFAVQPDVIVINLGSNDESEANKDLPAEIFREGLLEFLKDVRAKNPDAQILYTYGLVRTGKSEDIQAVIRQMQDAGDEKIHYLQLEQCQKWELNLNHTVETAYVSRGEAIIEEIRRITGW